MATPGAKTIADLAAFLQVPASQTLKTLLVEGSEGGVVALIVRGDHELNAVKAQKLPGVLSPLRMASAEQVLAATGCEPGFLGPVGLRRASGSTPTAPRRTWRTSSAARNERDMHLTGVNWGRDLPEPEIVDIRNVVAGDPSPTGGARSQSPAASRSATSSSSAASTARP